jgi:hypothetical protein
VRSLRYPPTPLLPLRAPRSRYRPRQRFARPPIPIFFRGERVRARTHTHTHTHTCQHSTSPASIQTRTGKPQRWITFPPQKIVYRPRNHNGGAPHRGGDSVFFKQRKVLQKRNRNSRHAPWVYNNKSNNLEMRRCGFYNPSYTSIEILIKLLESLLY